MIRFALFSLALFFYLSACSPATPPADAGAVPPAAADGGAAAPVVVNPASPAPATLGPDAGSAVVMPEATVTIISAPASAAAAADVKSVTAVEEKIPVIAPLSP
jgi:hypothetical protein